MAGTQSTCSVEDCGRSGRVVRGMCMMHYARWRKYGDTSRVELPQQNKPRHHGCIVEGCEGKHFAKLMCRKHYRTADYQANREARLEQMREYRDDPTRRILAIQCARGWREANPDRMKETSRARYERNREHYLEYRRAYREANRDQVRLNNAKRKKRMSEVAVSDLTVQQWRGIKADWGHRCAYCGATPDNLTMDHYIAIANGGNHTASNIVPACMSCNARKNDGPPPPFYYENAS